MILAYRISGFIYLFGCGFSVVALLSKIAQFKIPAIILCSLALLIFGGMIGAIILMRKKDESQDWIINLAIVLSLLIFSIVGGLIQL